jgi:hypothetical protein
MRLTMENSSAESHKDRRTRRLRERQGDAHRQDVERTRAYIQREGLCAVLNDTKWEELVEAMRASGNPRFRQKHVRADRPAGWDGEWYYHLRPFVCVEWVDIDPVERSGRRPLDRSPEIEAALRAIPVPFSREGPHLRVGGYTRPGVTPAFV